MLLCVLIIIMEMEKIFISPTDFKESTKSGIQGNKFCLHVIKEVQVVVKVTNSKTGIVGLLW